MPYYLQTVQKAHDLDGTILRNWQHASSARVQLTKSGPERV